MTNNLNSNASLRATAGVAIASPMPAKRRASMPSRVWSFAWALMGAFQLLQGHAWAGCLALAYAGFSLPEFTHSARTGGWLIWARVAVFSSLFLTVSTLLIGLIPDTLPSTSPAMAPAASNNPAPASAGQEGAPPARPNIAAEVAADDHKFMQLTGMGRDQLNAILKDPDSAKYQDVGAYSPPAAKGNVTFCGRVNSKNSFGGYNGYERFISAPNVGAWVQSSPGIKFNSVWHDICRPDSLIERAYF